MKAMINFQIVPFFFLSLFLGPTTSCDHLDDFIGVGNEEDKIVELTTSIPPGGNSWVVNDLEENQTVISDAGIHNWTDLNSIIRTYFKTDTEGRLYVGLNAKVSSGTSVIKVTVGNESKEISLTTTEYDTIPVGKFRIRSPGYHFIEIQGLYKESGCIGDINDILIGGVATSGELTYVKDDFYFGRRGPSVHLNYEEPAGKNVQWFYNELTVPEGEDVLGSYFMANGFGEGYFGIQVNSETERRVLFSVWSPYNTQNPDNIPDDYKIILLGKGEGVTTGEFGNEGSGGQSYLTYDWKSGSTYKFLLKGEPSKNDSTDYTAYFYAPEEGKWKLIASFRRPYTNTYLTDLHSFLENFLPKTGYISRKANYGNQWVYDTEGNWNEMTKAKFTADATARKGARSDYAGGVDGQQFYLENCGFFDKTTTVDVNFTRTANNIPPALDFSQLEVPKPPR